VKRANAKLKPENQSAAMPKYVCKADRENLAEEQTTTIPPVTPEQ